MKRRKGKYILKAGVITALTLAAFTGCGDEEKKVDYNIEGFSEEIGESENPAQVGGKSGLTQFAEKEIWEETLQVKVGEFEWNGDLLDTHMTLNVDAQIMVPQTEQMSVVEVEEPELDAEYRERMAEKFFDSGNIYYGDATHLPKRELQEIQNYLDRGGKISVTPADYAFTTNVIAQKLEALYDALDHIEEASDIYTLVEQYTTDEYIGTYEGRMYRLIFAECPGNKNNLFQRRKQMTWSVKDLYEVCPEKYKEVDNLECSPWMLGDWVENQCVLSEEEALKEAESFVEGLGLDYPVHSCTFPLLWGTPPKYVTEESASEDWGVSGYVFCFDLGVDDTSFVSYGIEEDYGCFGEHEDGIAEYSMEARLQIYVTDQGVIKVIADNPMEITGISEGVELLPLDTVKSIMKETMNEQWEILAFSRGLYINCFDEMELIYFRISDKANPNKYSYVPVWRLGSVTRNPLKNKISIEIPVLINAIDGSFINFADET